jgi:hypothetical protein
MTIRKMLDTKKNKNKKEKPQNTGVDWNSKVKVYNDLRDTQ